MPRFSNTSLGPNTQVTPFRTLEEYQENLSSQADGSNTIFSVAQSIDGGLKVLINGLVYTEADSNIVSVVGDKVTLSFAPQSDDIVIAIYSSYE
jgi:hypothetical protein